MTVSPVGMYACLYIPIFLPRTCLLSRPLLTHLFVVLETLCLLVEASPSSPNLRYACGWNRSSPPSRFAAVWLLPVRIAAVNSDAPWLGLRRLISTRGSASLGSRGGQWRPRPKVTNFNLQILFFQKSISAVICFYIYYLGNPCFFDSTWMQESV